MAVYNLSALADSTRYLESQGLSAQDAEKKAFMEQGFTANYTEEVGSEIMAEYQRLMANPTQDSEFARNDAENRLDRQKAGSQAQYDINPQPQATNADATPQQNQ